MARLRRRRSTVGKIERRDPVPIGRYWVDITEDGVRPLVRFSFSQWLDTVKDQIQVVRLERYSSVPSGIARDWYLFDVVSPVTWPKGKGFGLPTIVQSKENPTAPKVETSKDTAIRPPEPESFSDQLSNLLGDAKTLALLVLAAVAFSKMSGGRR